MKVGITENKPWTDLSGSLPQGVEVQLIEAIAHDLKAEVQWQRGSESALIEALKEHEIDVMIGGLSKKSLWAEEVGFTRPYRKEAVYVGVPQGAALSDIKGQEVGIGERTAFAAYVKKKGGIPIRGNVLGQFEGPVAAYAWELQRMGLQNTDIKLHEEEKSLAITRGENAWVMYLEQFFDNHQQEINDWLTTAPEP